MKFIELTIDQVKRFRSPLHLTDFKDGLNLWVGPNESGKSTLVRAIRAAFFERFKSSSVQDLQPWGDSAAAPEISLVFEWQGQRWSLTKNFLKKQRCDLHIDQQRYTNDEAEEKLAELLGYQFASRGASKAEHWGIPGLLWVEQGSIQDVRTSVDHAGDHLKSALSAALGDVVSSSGDELIQQVEVARAELLTKTGQPTGIYKKRLSECDDLRAECKALEEKIHHYRESVDRLAHLQKMRLQNDEKKPWVEYRKRATDAQQVLSEIISLQKLQDQDRLKLDNCRETLKLLREKLAHWEQQKTQLEERFQRKNRALLQYQELKMQTELHSERREKSAQSYEDARQKRDFIRAVVEFRRLEQNQMRLLENRTRLLENIEYVHKTQKECEQMAARLLSLPKLERSIQELKEWDAQLKKVRIQQEALATRIQYRLEPGQTLSLTDKISPLTEKKLLAAGEKILPAAEKMLSGEGETLLLTESIFDIPGVGKITVIPGGTDVADLHQKEKSLTQHYQSLCEQLNVSRWDEAQIQLEELRLLQKDLEQNQKLIARVAPKGLDDLRQQAQRLTHEQQWIEEELKRFPDHVLAAKDHLSFDDIALSLPDAEMCLAQMEGAFEEAKRQLADHQKALFVKETEYRSLENEWHSLAEELNSEQRQQREQECLEQVANQLAVEGALLKSLEERQVAIASANVVALEQDVARYQKTAEDLEKDAQQRERDIASLQVQLETLGAQGLEEKLGALILERQTKERHCEQFKKRAHALDLLLNLLKEKRQNLTRQLQAPLQKHLNHYLKLLFPNAYLTVDDALRPQMLSRSLSKVEESGDIEALSFGAREQMGLISRLAYADLLREAGRPTLIILDDALVHCDGDRLEQMKRILFDASKRHQILMFSCHPEKWVGLGVTPRYLENPLAAVI